MKTPVRNPLVFHPFLFAVYPILFLFSHNLGEVRPVEVIAPAAVALGCAGVLFVVLRVVLKDSGRAGALVSIAALMFFPYGALFEAMPNKLVVAGFVLRRHRILLPLWCAIFAVVVFALLRTRKPLARATTFFNVFAVLLLAGPVLTSSGYCIRGLSQDSPAARWRDVVGREVAHTRLRPASPLRDVYYIILDEYGRADMLKRCFAFDNSSFVDCLERKGFRVPRESVSNYLDTELSLASSLNMDYIQSMAKLLGSSPDIFTLRDLIRDSRVCHLFKKAGYEFVFFPSVFPVTSSNPNADLVVSSDRAGLSEFNRILVSNSVLQPFYSSPGVHARKILYALRRLEEIPRIRKPTLTFVHLICPHPPYVFDEHGIAKTAFVSKLDDPDWWREYTAQIAYLNKQIERAVDRILERSTVPPVIIIQGDHGPRHVPAVFCGSRGKGQDPDVAGAWIRPKLRSAILNAYYLPNGGSDRLYPTISPVNSFRVVLNYCIGTNYELIEDSTYDAKWSRANRSVKLTRIPR